MAYVDCHRCRIAVPSIAIDEKTNRNEKAI